MRHLYQHLTKLSTAASKRIFLIFFTFLFAADIMAQPTITSFSPASGTVGTTVTINGTNFNASPLNNTVYFGAVKANISAASPTSITVSAPAGATYEPITIMTNNQIAYSAKPFVLVFTGGDTLFQTTSFTPALNYIGVSSPRRVYFGDFNADGRSDMVVSNQGSNTISVFTNTGINTSGIVTFSKADYTTGPGAFEISIADIDCDGLLDIAVVNFNAGDVGTLSIFRNTSINGIVSFATKIDYTTGSGTTGIAVHDLNADGKPDILVLSGNSGFFSIFKNTSTAAGIISFAARIDYTALGHPDNVAINDLEGDGKPDLVINNFSASSISIYKNTSTTALISFAAKVDYPAGSFPGKVSIGDLDGDNKPDIAFTNQSSNTVSVLRNISTGGVISFNPKTEYPTAATPLTVSIGDLNGDGMPDLVVSSNSANVVSLLKNKSILGTMAFAASVDYAIVTPDTHASIGDLDGDGKPDLAVTSYSAVSIMRNKMIQPLIFTFTPTTAGTGAILTITGKNFTTVSSVSLGNAPVAAFSIISDSVISASVGGGYSGNLTVTNTAGSVSSPGFTFAGPPVISSFTPVSAAKDSVVTITGNNLTGATRVTFGDSIASFVINSATNITSIVGKGASGNVSVTTPYGTGTLAGFTFIGPPTITSFTPQSGPVGTSIIITGTNFSTTPLNNIVYFGTVRANVLAASTTSLSVTVPPGASFQYISVTANGFVSYASKQFIVTFSAAGPLNATSLAPKIDITAGSKPISNATGDLDGDGKPDIAVVNNASNTLSIFRNIGARGMISFDPKMDYATGTSPQSVSIADIDGDGKLDILVTNTTPPTISIFRNTSSVGNISFAPKVDVFAGNDPQDIAVGDFDGDGKADLAVVNYNNSSIAVCRNLGSIGSISFGSSIDLSTGNLLPQRIAIGDLNGDGKVDIAVSDYTSVYDSISIFKNTGTPGNISFDTKIDYAKSRGDLGIAIGDLDGDGRLDIATACWVSNKISVFKNSSTAGSISFEPKIDFVTGSLPESIALSDMDGDGKVDVCVGNFSSGTVSILRNRSSGGILSFGNKVDYTTGTNPKSISIADIDGDGKPDIVVANINANSISVIRNQLPSLIKLCPGGSTVLTSIISGTTYQWQQSSDSINFINLTDNGNFAGTNTMSLHLNNIPSSFYGYEYRCVANNINGDVFLLQFSNEWTGNANSSWENVANWSCGIAPDSNTDVIISGGAVIINSNVSIRSLFLAPGVSLTVNNGFNLIITH